MVQTMKNLLTKAKDPYEAILAYRATPLENGFSPAELRMGRRLRTTLPVMLSKLLPQWPELAKLKKTEVMLKAKQTEDYNKRHAAKELSLLVPGDRVYVPDRKENVVVVNKSAEPRSYLVKTNSNAVVRRNRRQLTSTPKETKIPALGSPSPPAATAEEKVQDQVGMTKDSGSSQKTPASDATHYPLREKSEPS